jgi:hypothetical protein
MLTGASRLHVALVQEPARSVPEGCRCCIDVEGDERHLEGHVLHDLHHGGLVDAWVFGSGMIPTLAVAR